MEYHILYGGVEKVYGILHPSIYPRPILKPENSTYEAHLYFFIGKY
jgi:hypothetical protein